MQPVHTESVTQRMFPFTIRTEMPRAAVKFLLAISFVILAPALASAQLKVTGSSKDMTCFGHCDGMVMAHATGGTPPYSYQWFNFHGYALDSIHMPDSTAMKLCAGEYRCVVSDGNGNRDTVTVIVADPPEIRIIPVSTDVSACGICDGSITVSVSGGVPPYSYDIWINNQPVPMNGGTFSQLCQGFYRVEVIDSAGCKGSTVVSVRSACDSVWPGDANYDGVANHTDLLSIGLSYGRTGPVRPNATTNWKAQSQVDWQTSQSDGVNDKHVDCNGNGVIDAQDTVAILLNYGTTHSKKERDYQASQAGPELYFSIDKDTAYTGDTLTIGIYLGSTTVPADSIYGLAFTVNFDNNYVNPGPMRVKAVNSWLGNAGSDVIDISRGRHNEGKLDAAMTRINHTHAGGFGKIGEFRIVVPDDVAGLNGKMDMFRTLRLWFSGVVVISADGKEQGVNPGDGIVIITARNTGMQDVVRSYDIRVYPNPAGETVYIVWKGVQANRIRLINATGQVVKVQNASGMQPVVMDVSAMPAGIYWIEVVDGQVVMDRRKMVINK